MGLWLVCAIGLGLGGCGNPKITQANFEKVKEGMTLAQLEEILGEGKKESQGDGSNVAGQFGVDLQGMSPAKTKTGDVYVWESGARKITVYFDLAGKVANKNAKGF
jgi:hypothetical protein